MALLTGAALLLEARNRAEIASFRERIGNWIGTDDPLPVSVLTVLGPGEFSLRNYECSADEPPIGLFLAYFPSQRPGNTIHSPKNCLSGAGWSPVESARIQIVAPDAESILINRYVVAKGVDH